MDTPTATLAAMISAFLDGRLGRDEFARGYQRQYSDAPPDTRAFHVLDRLWMVCEDYYEDLDIRDPGDTTDEELLAEARLALRELDELDRRYYRLRQWRSWVAGRNAPPSGRVQDV